MKTIQSQVQNQLLVRIKGGQSQMRKGILNKFILFQRNNSLFYIFIYYGSDLVEIIVLNWCRELKLLNLCKSSHFIVRL